MPVLLALLLAAGAPLDEDESFRAGLSAFKELRLQQAALSFQRVALDDSRAPHERARVQMWLGATYGQLGDLTRARAAFAFAFALSPDAMLPVRVSPKVTAVLEDERANARRQREDAIANKAREDAQRAARAPAPDVAPPVAPALAAPAEEPTPTSRRAANPREQQSSDDSELLWYVGAALAGVGATLTGAMAVATGVLGAGSYAVAADPLVRQEVADDAYLNYQTMLGVTIGMGALALGFGGAAAGLATLGVMAE